MGITKETRLIDLSLGELVEYLQANIKPSQQEKAGKEFVYGYKGVQTLFNCSNATACKLIHGKIKDAVFQDGRMIVVDKEKALRLFNS